jgi:hypothetical protein
MDGSASAGTEDRADCVAGADGTLGLLANSAATEEAAAPPATACSEAAPVKAGQESRR